MRRSGSLIRLGALLALLGLTVPAASAAIDIGPAVGSVAPPLSATSAAGKPETLASVEGKNGTVLVFVRSAKWCPFCQRQLIDLKAAQASLAARGYRLVSLSYDAPEVLAAFAAKNGIDYLLMSDPKSAMIDAYGIRDPQYPPGNFAYGVPMPAIFVLDTRGVVRAKLAEEGYRNRPPAAAVVAMVEALGK